MVKFVAHYFFFYLNEKISTFQHFFQRWQKATYSWKILIIEIGKIQKLSGAFHLSILSLLEYWIKIMIYSKQMTIFYLLLNQIKFFSLFLCFRKRKTNRKLKKLKFSIFCWITQTKNPNSIQIEFNSNRFFFVYSTRLRWLDEIKTLSENFVETDL